jgi:hypothetical protein
MSADKRNVVTEMLIACTLFAGGVLICAVSLSQIRAENRLHTAQATQPLQGTPSPSDQPTAPAAAKPGGERPTTPAPEPARPDPQTQGAAKPALPDAPAEKVAPPITQK